MTRRRPRLSRRFTPPEVPWTPEYTATHNDFIEAVLDDARLIADFADGRLLPRRYGVGLDERVVEYPWLVSRLQGRCILDAGSVLNHAHVLDRILPGIESLTIITLEPEAVSYPERQIDYRYGDLRELPFEDDSFDAVVCLSTLEHVGMDNSVYGVDEARAENPRYEAKRAIAELRRVAAPDGTVLISVPFGRREDHGWFRQFDAEDLDDLLEEFGLDSDNAEIFKYSGKGWQRSSISNASDCRYRDYHRDTTPVADLAAAARAVACVAIET